ncbi:MAG: hypothetical protein HKN24_05920 [Acidimicrobiales bacterium]|nr:hypothetical protein [Acidimicrobiales bacterium]
MILRIGETSVLDHSYADDIDHLWISFVSGADDVLRSGSGYIFWPDQPTKLHFDTFESGSTPYLKMWVEMAREPVEGREAYAPAAEFFSALAEAAIEFFDKYESLEPAFADDFAYSRQLIEAWFDQGLVPRRWR